MNNFIFDDIIDGNWAKLGDYWYYIDTKNNAEVLYKAKEPFNAVQLDCESISTEFEPIYIFLKETGKPYYIDKDLNTELYGVIDDDKNIIIPYKYKHLSCCLLDNDIVYLCAENAQNGLCGVIDLEENIKIPFMYDEIHDWNIDDIQNIIQVVYKGKCGIIDINNNVILPFKYKYIFGFYADSVQYSFAQNPDDKWGIIDRQGETVELELSNAKEVNLCELQKLKS